jgi:serine/threonine protein kinase
MIDQFVGKTLAEKYRIDTELRETDLGKIYHGTHLLMDKRVTIKILSPALAVDESIVKQFSAEARNISNISHPAILNVTDFGSDTDGTVFIVFDDADGESLKKKIRNEEEFSVPRAVNIVKQIAAALSAAHFKHTIHHGLNSDNILVSENDAVKVLDFGVVKSDETSDDKDFSEQIQYLSPEQCADSSEADERSDIYSLGVIFYEMLAGEVPFKAENTSELMLKHAQEPPPPLSSFRQDLPPEIEPIILQMLAKNPEMRHQNAAELIDDLNRASRNIGETKTSAATAGSPNNIWKTAFVVLAGISLLSVSLIWATSSKTTDPSTLQADANSMPVQPINPATGMNEAGMSNIVAFQNNDLSNSNVMLVAPDTLTGGGTNPNWDPKQWGQGNPIPNFPQGGQLIDPNNPNSPFVQDDTNTIYRDKDGNLFVIIPQPSSSDVNTKSTPTPKPTKSPDQNVTPTPEVVKSPKPQTTPTPNSTEKPTEKPTEQPKTEKTPTTQKKKVESGQNQDS